MTISQKYKDVLAALASAGSITGTELLWLVQGGVSKKIALSVFFAAIEAGVFNDIANSVSSLPSPSSGTKGKFYKRTSDSTFHFGIDSSNFIEIQLAGSSSSRRAVVGSAAILCSGDVASGNLSNAGSGAGSLTAGADAAYAASSILGGRAVQAIGTDDGRWRGLADVLGGSWTARSLSVWCFPLSFANNTFLWGQEQDPGGWSNPEIHTGITLDNASSGSWGVQFAASSARRQVWTNGVGDMRLGVWNHLAATLTVSGSDVLVRLYLNGVLVVASTVSSVTPDAAVSGARWSLGAEPKDAASRNPCKGALDDARAEAATWTAAYVRELYQRGIGAWTGT